MDYMYHCAVHVSLVVLCGGLLVKVLWFHHVGVSGKREYKWVCF